jgi:hypothetical protein
MATVDSTVIYKDVDDNEQVRDNLDRLASMGFTLNKDDAWPYYVSPQSNKVGPICTVEFEPLRGCDGWTIAEVRVGTHRIESVQIPEMETFGDVKRLCAALGIELKTSVPA